MKKAVLTIAFTVVLPFKAVAIAGGGNEGGTPYATWNGLTIKAENRCSPYDKSGDYGYDQEVEDAIVASMNGLVYGPYSGRYFTSDKKTDIEHIVATSEAHDSGLCSAPKNVRKTFASDLLNLTLAAPKVNRCSETGKCGLDAGEWLPEKNKCWFANRIVQVKQKYKLSIDPKEYRSLKSVLSNCDSTDMVFHPRAINQPVMDHSSAQVSNALALYDDNRNGKISCKEARAHNIAPVYRSHSAYKYMNDRDQDGVVCE